MPHPTRKAARKAAKELAARPRWNGGSAYKDKSEIMARPKYQAAQAKRKAREC